MTTVTIQWAKCYQPGSTGSAGLSWVSEAWRRLTGWMGIKQSRERGERMQREQKPPRCGDIKQKSECSHSGKVCVGPTNSLVPLGNCVSTGVMNKTGTLPSTPAVHMSARQHGEAAFPERGDCWRHLGHSDCQHRLERIVGLLHKHECWGVIWHYLENKPVLREEPVGKKRER